MVAYLIGEAVLVNLFMKTYKLSPLFISLLNLPAILAYILWFWPRYVGKQPVSAARLAGAAFRHASLSSWCWVCWRATGFSTCRARRSC
ncbi:MAG: hypothetical protein WKG07_21845 [Hymenobacter sp.]